MGGWGSRPLPREATMQLCTLRSIVGAFTSLTTHPLSTVDDPVARVRHKLFPSTADTRFFLPPARSTSQRAPHAPHAYAWSGTSTTCKLWIRALLVAVAHHIPLYEIPPRCGHHPPSTNISYHLVDCLYRYLNRYGCLETRRDTLNLFALYLTLDHTTEIHFCESATTTGRIAL
ncbi:hypothetical protein BDV95DRAFT_4445 [Massariosphaeria phaeospora]|uniref:Uncharacterized protein n=1 Tax=Massariosphaeria phaeospora TaxID=100035 RepID=A0A7C8IJ66_9PLEO|nr:hypothetical protein BDV95DRAFT_4445 [Massariosphaeria phaeospora]